MSITLDKDNGVNPFLVSCQICGGDTPELALLGNKGYTCECQRCEKKLIGTDKCPCGGFGGQRTKLDPHEKLPIGLCDDCKAKIEKEAEKAREEVERGGLYFRCTGCGARGYVAADNPLCAKIREEHGVPAPEPLGVETDACQNCGG